MGIVFLSAGLQQLVVFLVQVVGLLLNTLDPGRQGIFLFLRGVVRMEREISARDSRTRAEDAVVGGVGGRALAIISAFRAAHNV